MPVIKNYRNNGFSMIELVVVIVLLSIVAVFAFGNLSGQNNILARGFTDNMASAMRFAQKLAISSGCSVQVTVGNTAGNTGYQLFQAADEDECSSGPYTAAVPSPANRSLPFSNFDIPDGYSLSSNANIVFDARGEFVSATDFTYTVTNGTLPYSFTVYGGTGYVN
jgi:MSHA pilin protein MshC